MPRLGPIPASAEGDAQIEYGLAPELKWWKQCLLDGMIEGQVWPSRITKLDLHSAYLRDVRAFVKQPLDRTGFDTKLEAYVQDAGTKPTQVEGLLRDPHGAIVVDFSTGHAARLSTKQRAWKVHPLARVRPAGPLLNSPPQRGAVDEGCAHFTPPTLFHLTVGAASDGQNGISSSVIGSTCPGASLCLKAKRSRFAKSH